MIPEAAVEAAARKLFQSTMDEPWEAASVEQEDQCRAIAKEALEAAAPHMLGDAFERGFQKGVEFQEWAGHLDSAKPDFTNPYRSQA